MAIGSYFLHKKHMPNNYLTIHNTLEFITKLIEIIPKFSNPATTIFDKYPIINLLSLCPAI